MSDAPVLSVVTGLWPLAQAATEIGGAKVAVDDVVPAGDDPLAFEPDVRTTAVVQAAGLVLLAGGGLQPALDQAARGAPHVVRLADALRVTNPYLWLDPPTMDRAVQAMGEAMAAANPAAASLYRRNAGGLRSEISSLGIDYSSTLSTCPGTTMVIPDQAFTTMASHYSLTALIAPPGISPTAVQDYSSRLSGNRAGAAFSQPWVDDSGVDKVSAAAGLKVHAIDTLAGVPSSGTPAQNTYLNRMEQVLGVLSGALGCNPSGQ